MKPKTVYDTGTITLLISGKPIIQIGYRYKNHIAKIKEKWNKLYRLKGRNDVSYEIKNSDRVFRTSE